jgi:hypothetical protein
LKTPNLSHNFTYSNKRSNVALVPPASCFWREAEVRFGALKTKSCLSIENASSFCLAEKRARVAKNVQPALFLLFRFLLCVQKKMKTQPHLWSHAPVSVTQRSRICELTNTAA